MTDIQRVDANTCVHPEDLPGVSVERRALLWLPLAVAGGGILRGTPIRADGGSPTPEPGREDLFAPLSHEELAARWNILARVLQVASPEADESYAGELAGLVARVPREALPRLEKGRARDGIEAGPSWFLAPCVMVEVRLRAGAELLRHNHPPQVVLTLGLEGEARYEHYEIEGEAPPCTQIDGHEFRVRQTRAGWLRPGQTTSLTRLRDGIHGFVAGEKGARFVDFTVTIGDDFETFSYVALSPEALDPARGLFGATWTGKEGY